MTAASAAASQTKRFLKFTLSLLRRGFESGRCKTAAKMTVARIKLLRNKRQAVVKQMRRDIALLLQSGEDATARIRVEHVIREQNILAANEIIELFCELIVARLQIIAKRRECPADLKEGIASLIFAAPRCSEIPELGTIRDVFGKKYGKDFVSAAVDLRPNSGVNRMLIEKLSVMTPSGETKLKVMKEIAKEYQIEWDTTESEMELLKPLEEKIEGPRSFVRASSLPVNSKGVQPADSMKQTSSQERNTTLFQDTASAAEAAAESAKRAIAAAEAAAYLANRGSGDFPNTHRSKEAERLNRRHSYNNPPAHSDARFGQSESCQGSDYKPNDDLLSRLKDPEMYRRHSYNAPSLQSDVKFDESDFEDEIEMDMPPPSETKWHPLPRVHPKLPDYDQLAARFESLKYRK